MRIRRGSAWNTFQFILRCHLFSRFDAYTGMTAGKQMRPSSIGAQEDVVSGDSIHIIIAVGVIALLFSWVPLVNVVCPPGWRSTEESSTEEKKRETPQLTQSSQRVGSHPSIPPQVSSMSSLSSGRLADQSRDLLRALSTRDHSQPSASRIPQAPAENPVSRKEINKTCAE